MKVTSMKSKKKVTLLRTDDAAMGACMAKPSHANSTSLIACLLHAMSFAFSQ